MSEPPLVLAVECASRIASVALVRDSQVLVVRSARSDQHHAESLLSEIDGALAEAGCRLDAVEAFAVSVGPGAFTSLRIGISTVKGLAFGSDRPVAAVSTLAAIAQAVAPSSTPAPLVAVLDARRGEVYAGVFDAAGEFVVAVGDEGVETAETQAAQLPRGARLIGELPPHWLDALRELGRDDLDVLDFGSPPPRALAVARLGQVALRAGEGVSAERLTPNYLRRPEAEEKRLAAASSLDTSEKLQ